MSISNSVMDVCTGNAAICALPDGLFFFFPRVYLFFEMFDFDLWFGSCLQLRGVYTTRIWSRYHKNRPVKYCRIHCEESYQSISQWDRYWTWQVGGVVWWFMEGEIRFGSSEYGLRSFLWLLTYAVQAFWGITSCTLISLNSNCRRQNWSIRSNNQKELEHKHRCWLISFTFYPPRFFSPVTLAISRYQILGSWSCFDPQEMTRDPSRCGGWGTGCGFFGGIKVSGFED